MSIFKKCKVAMLSTDDTKAPLGFLKDILFTKGYFTPSEHQHLYILSDDEIKEGDWCLDTLHNHVFQFGVFRGSSNSNKKVIATTDESLKIPYDGKTPISENWGGYTLPQPSQSFIEKYVEEYNKGNVITDVLVEYNEVNLIPYGKSMVEVSEEVAQQHFNDFGFNSGGQLINKLKINPKDNTITIKKVKDSWSREEVIELCKKAYSQGHHVGIINEYSSSLQFFDKWIEENL